MTILIKPETSPANPDFSSGPCAKRPGYDLTHLNNAVLGRSHRSKPGKSRLLEAITRTRDVLNVPEGWHIGIVPASDTGAYEMAMWSLLGERGLDILGWESFGKGWITDAVKQLKLDDIRVMEAAYGDLPDLSEVDFSRDVAFTWNGTTSGVKVPNGDWIADDRTGLTLCDATSAAFAMDLPWEKLDVTTFSWQKVMGSEAAHGMLILSPRAVERLESYTPPWPLPKIFRLTKGGKLIEGIFKGETINTPSMLAVEDYVDALKWAEDIGGLPTLLQRSADNLAVLSDWVALTDWVDFLCAEEAYRSNTSICLKIVDSDVIAMDEDAQAAFAKGIAALLDAEGAAYDIGAYRDAPPGLRIWGGATVETADLEILTQWLDWAFATAKEEL
ncbi:Exodeoxyribonuclease 7 large subunit protein [Candidatus Micropelagos thuwalensis]|uniref:phosphoserine transaminase n=1 Tax=Candidatus Micropelagius thuwalensis TaxID=1397666 RepID=U2WRV4_9PROT|nr:phosphoserine transaminase [Candidatus Micropelagos thuwalensis]ERL46258.1 Exodeoxyribonuclease 7 large subunit protein [Candidatus Micropelagos thuwalensis]